MANNVDPNKVLLTGENHFIRLAEQESGEFTSRVSFWRILLSPNGPGHVLFIVSEISDNAPVVYSDNIAMTRWLQKTIETHLFEPFGDLSLPVIDAEFEKSGDLRSYWTEEVFSRDEDISLTWYALGEPFILHSSPGVGPTMPHGVCTLLIPAAGVRLVVNGEFASGRPFPQDRDGTPSSTCCLAFSESWLASR